MTDLKATFANSLKMVIRLTINKKRRDVDTIDVPYPILSELHSALPAPTSIVPEKDDDDKETGGSLPQYKDAPILQWAQDALVEACKREARSVATVDTTGEKPVISFLRAVPVGWETLCEEHKRMGGQHLVLRRECISRFNDWVDALKKSAKAAEKAKALFSNPKALENAAENIREKFGEGYLLPFAAELSEEEMGRFEGHLGHVNEATETDEVLPSDF